MRTYDPSKALAAIHVPKCGGTSVLNVMKRWFGRRLLLHYFDEQRNRMPRRRRLRRGVLRPSEAGVCLYGHFERARGFGAWDYYPQIEQFVTILREPFEMAVSNFFYAKRLGDEWYRNGEVRDPMASGLAEHLKQLRRTYLLEFFPIKLTEENWQEHIEKHFIWVGVTEHLQESLDIIADKLGKKPVKVPVVNTSPWDEEVTQDMRDEFRAKHELEYRIYEYALRCYHEEMQARSNGLAGSNHETCTRR